MKLTSLGILGVALGLSLFSGRMVSTSKRTSPEQARQQQAPQTEQVRRPAVIKAGVPFYPSTGMLARVQGRVVLLATVGATGAASAVLDSCTTSTAERVLCAAAMENFRTWEFMPGQPGSLTVTYTYQIAGAPTNGIGNPRVEFDFPSAVTITMPPVQFRTMRDLSGSDVTPNHR